MSAEFIRRKILEGTAPAVPKFCGRAGARPSKLLFATRYSLLTIRYSPVANRCRSRHEPRPPEFVHRKIWERG